MASGSNLALGGEAAGLNGGVALANGKHATDQSVGWDDKANIFLRLLRAAADVPQLEKDGQAGKKDKDKGQRDDRDSKGFSYDYITHDMVSMHAKKVLVKHGIYFAPEITDIKQEGNRTEIRIHGHFINVDDADQRVTFPGVGYGVDSSDKGPGKAYSYACKYVLAKALMMNTADDIEATDAKFEPDTTEQIRKEAKQDKSKTLQAWASSYKAALTRATTLAELIKLQRENREQLLAEETPDITRDFFVELFEQRKKLLGGGDA